MPASSDFNTFKQAFISESPSTKINASHPASTQAPNSASSSKTATFTPSASVATAGMSSLTFGKTPSPPLTTSSGSASSTAPAMASAPVAIKGSKPVSTTGQSGGISKRSNATTPAAGKVRSKIWKYETFPFSTVWRKGDSLTFSNPPLFVCPVGETIQNIYGDPLPPSGVKLDDNSVWQILNSSLKRKEMAKKWPHDFMLKGIKSSRPHRGFGALKDTRKGWQFVDGRYAGVAQTFPPYLLCGDPLFMNGWSPFEEKRRNKDADVYDPSEKPPALKKRRIPFDPKLLLQSASITSDSDSESNSNEQKKKRAVSEESDSGRNKRRRVGSRDSDSECLPEKEGERGDKGDESDIKVEQKLEQNSPVAPTAEMSKDVIKEASGQKVIQSTSSVQAKEDITTEKPAQKNPLTSSPALLKEQAVVPKNLTEAQKGPSIQEPAEKLSQPIPPSHSGVDDGSSTKKSGTVSQSVEKKVLESQEKNTEQASFPQRAATPAQPEDDDESEDDLIASLTRLERDRLELRFQYRQFVDRMDSILNRQFRRHQYLSDLISKTKKAAETSCPSCRERLLPAFDASFDPTEVDEENEQEQEQEGAEDKQEGERIRVSDR